MKIRTRYLGATVFLASHLLANPGALAQSTATVAETGTVAGLTTNLQLPVNSVQNYFVGSQNISVNGSGSFLAFCVDPFQYASGTPATYNVYSGFAATPFAGQRATDMATLYSQSYASTLGNSVGVNNLNSAAFQLALWELANDDGVLTSGGVQQTGSTNSNVVSLANSMITNAKTGVVGPTQYAFTVYQHPTQQDYLVSVTAVPEPASYAMLLAGMGLMGWQVQRRKRVPAQR